jgi:RNA polymerase sigma factor (sigma-70 family)
VRETENQFGALNEGETDKQNGHLASVEPLTKPQSNGNEQSFEHLYREHRADVYRFVLRNTGNPEEAEDVTQTAFLNAYKAYVRSGPPEKPKAWLFAIAQNVRRRGFRTQSRRPIETPLEEDPVAPSANEDALSAHEISAALASIPLNQRSVLVLRELGGLTYTEISEELGLSVSAVQMLLFRARRALRAELEPARVPSRALGGLLPFPVPAWLSKVASWFGSSFERTGVLTRAAGVVGAAIVGTAVVAGSDPGRALPDLRPERAARVDQAVQPTSQPAARAGSPSAADGETATRTSVAATSVGESRRVVRRATPARIASRPQPDAQAPAAAAPATSVGGSSANESAASQAPASRAPKNSPKNSVLPDVKLPPVLEQVVPPSLPKVPDLPPLPPLPDVPQLPNVPPLPPVPPLPQLPPPPTVPTPPVQPPSVPTLPTPPVSPPALPSLPPVPPLPPPPKLP